MVSNSFFNMVLILITYMKDKQLNFIELIVNYLLKIVYTIRII